MQTQSFKDLEKLETDLWEAADIFDLLMKANISNAARERVKQASKNLLRIGPKRPQPRQK